MNHSSPSAYSYDCAPKNWLIGPVIFEISSGQDAGPLITHTHMNTQKQSHNPLPAMPGGMKIHKTNRIFVSEINNLLDTDSPSSLKDQ